MVRSHSQTHRNTIIIEIAAAASIAASLAGYYATEAEKYYHLSDAALTTAVHFEHQADLQAREDEELLIQATIEYRKNETRIGDLLASQVSQEAKNNIAFDKQNNTLSLLPKYYDVMYSDYLNTTKTEQKYLERADLSNEYSRQFIIATSLLTATIVILSELTRRKENRSLT
jgi:replicative DNA helicase